MLAPLRTVTRAAFVAEARDWLGTPYHHQGRVKGVGVDCIGLPIGVARVLGILPPTWDITGYARDPDGVTLKTLCDAHLIPIAPAELRTGDLAVQVLPRGRLPQHFGIIVDHTGGLGMVHAHGGQDGRGQVVQHGLGAALRHRIVLAYRIPGVV